MRDFSSNCAIFILFSLFSCPVLAEEFHPVIFESMHRALLPAQQAGKVTELNVDTGDSIEKGQILAIIDHNALLFEKKRLEAIAQFSTKKANNLKQLHTKGLSADIELADALKEKSVSLAEKNIVEVKIDQSLVKAPFNGQVTKRHIQPFEWVTVGQPVLEVLDREQIRAVAFLPAELATRLTVGDEHVIEVLDLQEQVTGTLVAIAPGVEVKSNTVSVIWHFKDLPKTVRAGMKGQVAASALTGEPPKTENMEVVPAVPPLAPEIQKIEPPVPAKPSL